jgi:hypothetical protein
MDAPHPGVYPGQHNDVGEGEPCGVVALGCGVVGIKPNGTVGADEQKVSGCYGVGRYRHQYVARF